MLALDLIGVKVFRYSDETAEAVASGEKLLKESGTIYESFADVMSPEDAKRYLDFLDHKPEKLAPQLMQASLIAYAMFTHLLARLTDLGRCTHCIPFLSILQVKNMQTYSSV